MSVTETVVPVTLDHRPVSTSTYNNPNEHLHVVCQEVGHTFGLDHQDTSGASLNTCMDYFSNTGANATSTLSTHPNQHDYDELSIIYSHLDSTTTVGAATTLPNGMTDPDFSEPGSWGRWSRAARTVSRRFTSSTSGTATRF